MIIIAVSLLVIALLLTAPQKPSRALPEGEVLAVDHASSVDIDVRRESGDYETYDLPHNKWREWPPVFIIRDGITYPVTADMVTSPTLGPSEGSKKQMKIAEEYGPGL
jgi:hypothetical protein